MQLSGRHAGLIIPVAMVAAAVLTVTLLGRPPAAAALTAAAPAAGSNLGTPPAAITLTFTAAVSEAHVEVSGAQTGGGPQISGATVTQPVTISGTGSHVVDYHVVTREGDEIAGRVSFTVGGSGSRSGSGSGSGSGSAGSGAATPPAAQGHDHGGLDGLTATVLGANLVVIVVLGGLLLRRRGERRP